MKDEAMRIIRIGSPIDLSQVKEVPSKEEEEKNKGTNVDALCKEIYGLLNGMLSFIGRFSEKDEKTKEESDETGDHIFPDLSESTKKNDKIVCKAAKEIAKMCNINPKNVTRKLRSFNSYAKEKIGFPLIKGEKYSATQNVWNELKKFCNK